MLSKSTKDLYLALRGLNLVYQYGKCFALLLGYDPWLVDVFACNFSMEMPYNFLLKLQFIYFLAPFDATTIN